LEAQSTTNITINNTFNHVSINIRPFKDNFVVFSDSDMPARAVVKELMATVMPPQVVPLYIDLKHFRSGPEFANVRIKDSATGLEVVEEGNYGGAGWVSVPTEWTLNCMVKNAFYQVDRYHIDEASFQGQQWKAWVESEELLDGDSINTGQCAFKKMVQDTEKMLHKRYLYLHIPREAVPEEDWGSESSE
jgi:hypothetical protein